MKRNYILGCIISFLFLFFGFACKHSASSETSATPDAMKQDCIKYAGLNNKAGLLEEYEGIQYWDVDAVTQFKDEEVDVKTTYNYLINGEGSTFYLDRVRFQGTINDTVRIPLEHKCKQLLKDNPNEKGIVALFVRGEKKSKKTICTFDLWDCKSNDFVRTYVNEQTEFSISDYIQPSCQSKMKFERGSSYSVGRGYIIHFDRVVDMCYKNPTSKSLEKIPGGSTSKDWEIYIENISDSTQIYTVEELLKWKVPGKFGSLQYKNELRALWDRF